jgi:hypothetical protein
MPSHPIDSPKAIMPSVHPFPSIPTGILSPIDFSPSSQATLEMATGRPWRLLQE